MVFKEFEKNCVAAFRKYGSTDSEWHGTCELDGPTRLREKRRALIGIGLRQLLTKHLGPAL